MLSKILSTVICLLILYFVISLVTIMKNGVALLDPPGLMPRLKAFLSINEAKTSPQHDYPELQSRYYTAEKQEIFNRIKSAAEKLGYTLVTQTDNRFHFIVTTSLMKFKDDVYITVAEEKTGLVINAKSTSRKGRADFGANLANITRLFDEIDKQ